MLKIDIGMFGEGPRRASIEAAGSVHDPLTELVGSIGVIYARMHQADSEMAEEFRAKLILGLTMPGVPTWDTELALKSCIGASAVWPVWPDGGR